MFQIQRKTITILMININSEFREELKMRNDSNIDEFLSLPELIPAKTRKKQQPLLDYMKGLEELLAKKEATATIAQKKNKENEASNEQRKLQREQQQKEKEDRAAQRAQKKPEKELQQHTKRRRRGTLASHHKTFWTMSMAKKYVFWGL